MSILGPLDGEDHLDRGEELAVQGELGLALAEFDAALAAGSLTPEQTGRAEAARRRARTMLCGERRGDGIALGKAGEVRQARLMLETALALADDPEARREIGALLAEVESRPVPGPGDTALGSRRRRGVELALVLALYFLPVFLYSVDGHVRDDDRPIALASELYGVLRNATAVALLIYLVWMQDEPLGSIGLSPVSWSKPAWWIRELALVIAVLAVQLLTSAALHRFEYAAGLVWLGSYHPGPRPPDHPLVSAATLLVSALYQELLFRGYINRRIEQLARSRITALLVSSLLFGLWHSGNAVTRFNLFVAGLIFGAFYLTSRSLPRVTLAHWVWNLRLMR